MSGYDSPEPAVVDYLTDDDVLALIEAELGTRHVIRDAGLLAAAIARPQAVLFGEPTYAGLAGKAAALMHSIVSSHPLLDGNKRLGVTATLLFYALNGIRILATDDELYDLVMGVASGEIIEVETIAKHLRSWEVPLRPGDAL